ncbi:PaaI family thioesterase [Abyssibius alkaniclasticus]|uniref:PaaI family thioesterase n=1 Tax=Abyssibius alkaniclasticus TaxID=2881234 RepID=UPI00236453EF|nr:PaaI family thioesterase [Abyssibius alkaniclasticus]UPH69891.1 PaaI family thioesterase [Abyssibius alkaniclasticus]|tara:strand:+ start:2405 stop:2920 length:516 start_codon:yes stop_codon:yes gene_type:complete
MKHPHAEPVQQIKLRRDTALERLVQRIPYARHLDVQFDRRGDELTARLPFAERLIGNPLLPALHGGAVGAFLEIAAQIELSWSMLWAVMEEGAHDAPLPAETFPQMPKTIDFTVDYLRSGRPRDAYARARVNRQGRRYASVQVEAWQDNRDRPFAMAVGHFLMPPSPDGPL